MSDSKRSDEANEGLLAFITEPRLRPYLHTCEGDLSLALDLYAWNTRMAAACLPMLSQTEILLRNALDEQLKEYFDEAMRGIPWFFSEIVSTETKGTGRDFFSTRDHGAGEENGIARSDYRKPYVWILGSNPRSQL